MSERVYGSGDSPSAGGAGGAAGGTITTTRRLVVTCILKFLFTSV
jgi:hypothetical protein